MQGEVNQVLISSINFVNDKFNSCWRFSCETNHLLFGRGELTKHAVSLYIMRWVISSGDPIKLTWKKERRVSKFFGSRPGGGSRW